MNINNMPMIRVAVAVVLCGTMLLAENPAGTYKINDDGGSLQKIKSGHDLRISLDSSQIRLLEKKGDTVSTIPVSSITESATGRMFIGGSDRQLGWPWCRLA